MEMKLVWVVILAFTWLNALELNEQIEACNEGNITSCMKAGITLTSGKNAEDQEKKNMGLEYIRKACKYGETKACDIMGENYFKDRHYGAAKPYFEASCERGIASACAGLGTIYRDGHDVRQDDVLSRQYYEKACALQEADACINVAIIYRGGFGVERNRVHEKEYYKKACEAGSKAGCNSFILLDNEDKGIEEPGLWDKFKSLFN